MLRSIYFLLRTSTWLVAVTLFTSLPTASFAEIKDNSERIRIELGHSPIGNYLAGRHAQARHDFEAALTFLTAALSPDSTT